MARTPEHVLAGMIAEYALAMAKFHSQNEQQAERLVQLEAELASLKAPKPETETDRFRHSSMLKPD